jgi:hypothetical protein
LPRPEAIFNLSFEVEHILPQASGGESSPDNLARSCRSCNLHKSDAVAAFDEETQSTVRFLHPCRDAWREHFAVNAETGEIEGLTDIGRMTVLRLRINSPAQVAARRQWLKLGFISEPYALGFCVRNVCEIFKTHPNTFILIYLR